MRLSRLLYPSAYWAFAVRKYVDLRYTVSTSLASELVEQRAAFARLGLDFDAGMVRLNHTLQQMGLPAFDEANGMASQHWPLFASMAESGGISSILEIGTFDAGTTTLLTNLFPQAAIVTIDLPDNSPHFLSSYGREDREYRRNHIVMRNRRLMQAPKVEFLQINSFLAPAYLDSRRFDLIWVDGGHDNPVVAWDLFFAFHHLAPRGWLAADDIYRHPRARDLLPYANDSDATLRYLEQDGSLPQQFVKKRLASGSKNLVREKHILVVRGGSHA